jgi:hypothetical protein
VPIPLARGHRAATLVAAVGADGGVEAKVAVVVVVVVVSNSR